MPGSISGVTPTTVLPQTLCTAFTESRSYPQITNLYHDGTPQVGLLGQTSQRTFKMARRLGVSDIRALRQFWIDTQGGLLPFYFYSPYEGSPVGSNYDPTGVSLTGRVLVVFRGAWGQSTGLSRTDVPNLELVEINLGAPFVVNPSYIPTTAVSARITITSTRFDFVYNDGYSDEVSLTVNGGSNLVINGGAESGLTGWTSVRGAMQSVLYGSPFPPAPPSTGIRLFAGGNGTTNAVIQQVIDLSSYAASINSGSAAFKLSAYLGGYQNQNDHATVMVEWMNAGGTVLGSATIGPVTPLDRNNQTIMLYRST